MPALNEKLKKKMQITQNKYILIYPVEFQSVNQLPVDKRVHLCINAITLKGKVCVSS